MHIKQIKIFNFKSFSHTINLEEFSAGMNFFIGINGAGKSNLFDAVNKLFLKIPQNKENFSSFFNKSISSMNKSRCSMIQINFDNKNRDFPIPCDELIIRRIFGSKIDKFLINGHNFCPPDFFNLIESSGFDLDNSFLRIKQGYNCCLKFFNP
jgi:chromosome segregation ATPase